MKFTIGFEKEDRHQLHRYWNDIIDRDNWSWPGSYYERTFEENFASHNGSEYAIAFSSWWGAARAVMQYLKQLPQFYGHKYTKVICPSNTFMATPLVAQDSGYEIVFVDCNKNDLCMSYDHLKVLTNAIDYAEKPIVFLVHIGGHIAFETDKIRKLCEDKEIFLIEDCAHSVGASWHGKKAGTFGLAGVWSFHATKTISTGEGGMVTTYSKELNDFARKFRDYGKDDYKIQGGNYRMSEFTAAIGVVQTKRIGDIVHWKREKAKEYDLLYSHIEMLATMHSGYYKYITFDKVDQEFCCGKVYEEPCHRIMGQDEYLPNTDWVAENHNCIKLYYKG